MLRQVPHLPNSLVGLHLDVGNIGVGHEAKQVQDQVGRLSEDVICSEAVRLEALIVDRVEATHGFHHFLCDLHGSREWLWVTAENEAKIDMEYVAYDHIQRI